MKTESHCRIGILLAVLLTTASASPAADFVVTKASYTDTHATFTLSSNVLVGDTAEVTIAEADAGNRAVIRQTLHPTANTIAEETPTNIKLSVKPPAAGTVTLTFTNKIVAGAVEVRHRLDKSGPTLKSSIVVTVASGTPVNWVNADLEVQRPSGTVTASGVNLEVGKLTVLPATEIHAIGISNVAYLRTGDIDSGTVATDVHDVFTLTNNSPSSRTILAGSVDVFDGATYLYTRQLPDGLAAAATVDIHGAKKHNLKASAPGNSADVHIEVVSLSEGLLVTQAWSAKPVTVANTSGAAATIRFGRRSDINHRSNPEPQPQLTGDLEEKRTAVTRTLNLLEIGNDSDLAGRIAALDKIQFGHAASRLMINKVKRHYKNIWEARMKSLSVAAALTRLTAVLGTLRITPGTDPALITRVQAAVDRLTVQKAAVDKREPTILIDLTADLFP